MRAAITREYRQGPTASLRTIERVGASATAVGLLAYGVRRQSADGWCVAACAAPLAYVALTGHWPTLTSQTFRGARGAEQHPGAEEHPAARALNVRESVRLERPVDEVYRFWSQLDNLPRFMANLERVTDLGGDRSRWVARGPAGVTVEWEAEITERRENRLIRWQSLPGADVAVKGLVSFDPVREGRSTQVTVTLHYAPPGGRAGALLATVTGSNPSQTIREDLRRLKQVLEAGELARATASDMPTPAEARRVR
jgi:uncharacterized membrane protein